MKHSNTIPVREAVTAVIMVGDEILLLHRNPALRAFAGFDAFPGGTVETGDDHPAALQRIATAEIPAHRLNALARELREEIGLDLDSFARNGQIAELGEIGYALTPPVETRRFSTWFYRLRLNTKPALDVNQDEHTRWGWATPAQWLDRYAAGELMLVPPTLLSLRDLANDPFTPQLGGLAAIGKPPLGQSFMEIQPLSGITMMMVPSNTLPPARHTNCFIIGDGGNGAPRLLVDPSPADDEVLNKLHRQIEGRIDAILITHHHIDHNERADSLARRCKLPLWLSADTRQRIVQTRPTFFDGLDVRELADGEIVTQWLGQPVRILAVPGHDAGQLALLPDNRAWCLVGDLIQGIGTVVIAPPEGDMAQYFKTLENVIGLQPRTIFPSHGLPLGGTHYLQAALDHRRLREQQVLELTQDGKSEDEILQTLYADTPAPLLPYARINVQMHTAKLRVEGMIQAPG